MQTLRAQAVEDLRTTLEGEFGMVVTLIAPDGSKIDTTKDGLPLKGRVLYSQARTNLETGERISVPEPLVILRRASLSRIPQTGENWAVSIPEGPAAGAALVTYALDGSQAVGSGESLGFVRLPLTKAVQS